MKNLYISYQNYENGVNNLCIVEDTEGNYGTSTKGKEKAIKNYYRNLKERFEKVKKMEGLKGEKLKERREKETQTLGKITKIQKFEKVINENKSGMLQIIILYNISCHDNYTKLNDLQKEKILGFLYNLYLKDETKTDLSTFSDIAMNNYLKVLNEELTRYNIYDFLEV